jgi:tetratricopeptide (TPR) repeat protein
MRKETIMVAVQFFVLGFWAGYVYDAQQNWKAQQRAASGARTAGQVPGVAGTADATAGAMLPALPEGHPPTDAAGIIKTLQAQAAKNPQDLEPRLKLANYYYDQHQFQPAAEWYQKALELDPKNVDARTDLATAYFYLGRPQDALREYRKTLQIDPKHEPTMFNLIVVHLEGTHDLAAAQQAWDRLHKQNPNYPGLDHLKQSLDAARTSAKP